MVVQASRLSNAELALSLVTDIEVSNWASEIVLVCLDDPLTRRRYDVVFTNCRDVRWSLDAATANLSTTEADIIGFYPGRANFVEQAILTTDLFELSVVYDRLEIRQPRKHHQGKRNPAAA